MAIGLWFAVQRSGGGRRAVVGRGSWGNDYRLEGQQHGSSSNGLHGRLFRELAKALEETTVGNCITDEVLKAAYKLYYSQV